jgi:hypothetical protein
VIVPPFEHRHIIAGQGTAGVEFAEQAAALGLDLDALLTPTSGGGLTAGLALAMAGASPGTAVHCVEPEGFDDYRRSLASGQRERNPTASGSICDALLTQQPGELTFAINRRLVAGGFAVSEDEVRHAMRQAFSLLKLVVEPGGAVALAAVLAGRIETAGRTVGVMLSGGNVDPRLYAEVLAAGPMAAWLTSRAETRQRLGFVGQRDRGFLRRPAADEDDAVLRVAPWRLGGLAGVAPCAPAARRRPTATGQRRGRGGLEQVLVACEERQVLPRQLPLAHIGVGRAARRSSP